MQNARSRKITLAISLLAVFFFLSTLTARAQQSDSAWQAFINVSVVNALAAEGDFVWAATDGGVLRWDRRSIALSLLVFFLYGGMIWGVLPQNSSVSFESHLFGAVTGVALAFLLRNRDPRPVERRYSWEDEESGG